MVLFLSLLIRNVELMKKYYLYIFLDEPDKYRQYLLMAHSLSLYQYLLEQIKLL